MISVVIPIHNEAHAIASLHGRLTSVLKDLRRAWEIIYVDDASTDGSFELLKSLAQNDTQVVVVRLRRNFGQTAALAAGFDMAGGEIIISMDGDLQHDPADIPALLSKLEEGYDIASGWRRQRTDNALTRRLPSRVANWCMAKASGLNLRDFGTTFKAYRAEVLKDVRLYGELHRFIPALASFYGARVAEVPISNSPRAAGSSHYGLGRTFHVLFDILTIKFLLSYFTRPMHFFGKLGVLSTSVGGLVLAYLLVFKLRGGSIMEQHGPLMVAGGLLLLAGLLLFCTGVLGELVMRTYFESAGRKIYAVREVLGGHRESVRRALGAEGDSQNFQGWTTQK